MAASIKRHLCFNLAVFKHLAAYAASQSPLSCFPVLCCSLAFPFGTPVYLRLTDCVLFWGLCCYPDRLTCFDATILFQSVSLFVVLFRGFAVQLSKSNSTLNNSLHMGIAHRLIHLTRTLIHHYKNYLIFQL